MRTEHLRKNYESLHFFVITDTSTLLKSNTQVNLFYNKIYIFFFFFFKDNVSLSNFIKINK